MPLKRSPAGSSSAIKTEAAAANDEPKFTIASPVKFDWTKTSGFPERCYYCTKRISPDSDVHMYNDCAFCSFRCRDIQMNLDKAAEENRKHPK